MHDLLFAKGWLSDDLPVSWYLNPGKLDRAHHADLGLAHMAEAWPLLRTMPMLMLPSLELPWVPAMMGWC